MTVGSLKYKKVLFLSKEPPLDALKEMLKYQLEIILVSPKLYEEKIGKLNKKNLIFVALSSFEDDGFCNQLLGYEFDYLFCYVLEERIPKALIDCAKCNAFNFHAVKLPEYKGAHPFCALILNQEKENAICVHQLTEHFDDGSICYEYTFALSPLETGWSLAEKIRLYIGRTFKNFLSLLNENKLEYKPNVGGRHYARILHQDTWIDPACNAEYLSRLIRAHHCYLPAIVVLTGFPRPNSPVLEINFIEAQAFSLDIKNKASGSVYFSGGKAVMDCGVGKLQITCFRLETYGILTPERFLNLYDIKEPFSCRANYPGLFEHYKVLSDKFA